MIHVDYIPSVWVLDKASGRFVCEHENTYPDMIEHYDHEKDAVTGQPQPLYYEPIEVCEQCEACYSNWSEEWYDE